MLCHVCDDLYHPCTYSSLEVATTLKQASFYSFKTGLLPDMQVLERSITGRVFFRDILKGGNIDI